MENVFILSPGRTGTTSFARILSCIPKFTSGHETRVKFLGDSRIDYPSNHIEADNRLVFFLPKLTKRYAANSLLIILYRPNEEIADSYSKRWYKTNLMKAYAQGILLRSFRENDIAVSNDMVSNTYETIEYFANDWKHVVRIDLHDPSKGLKEFCLHMNLSDEFCKHFKEQLDHKRENINRKDLRHRLSIIKYSLQNLIWDVQQCFR